MPTIPDEFHAEAVAAGAIHRRAARRIPSALSIRGAPEWTRWVNGFARQLGLPTAVLIDVALRRAARDAGYPAPPSRYVECGVEPGSTPPADSPTAG